MKFITALGTVPLLCAIADGQPRRLRAVNPSPNLSAETQQHEFGLDLDILDEEFGQTTFMRFLSMDTDYDRIDSWGHTIAERRILFKDQLSTLSSQDSIDQEGSPQNLAFQWIVEKDGLQISPSDPTLTQRYVMAVFYYSTNGDAWINCNDESSANPSPCIAASGTNIINNEGFSKCYPNSSEPWLSSVSECKWCGNSCNTNGRYKHPGASNGTITDIALENVNQSGTLPIELKALTDLGMLLLEKGTIGGSIPAEIGSLTELIVLDLDFQRLSGPIPEEIFNLSILIQLDLNDNLFTGTLSSSIMKLESLRFLQLDANGLTSTIPSEIGTLSVLSQLSLGNNTFDGTLPTFSPATTALNVRGNQLSGNLESISGYSFLETLDLSDNELEGTIPASVAQPGLDTINFDGNNLTGSMPAELCSLRDTMPETFQVLRATCYGNVELICDCCTEC